MRDRIISSDPELGIMGKLTEGFSASDFRPPQDYGEDGADHIRGGGEFLNVDAAQPNSSESVERELVEGAVKYYRDMAEIAAIVNHPGFKAILGKIDSMIETERVHTEYAMERSVEDPTQVLDPVKMQLNLYAITRLKNLKKWLNDQSEEYQETMRFHDG